MPVACPECGKMAIEDYYYRTGAGYIICSHCGCEVDREAKYDKETGISYIEEVIRKGYGRIFLQKSDGQIRCKLLNSPLTNEEIISFKKDFSDPDTDQDNSYLVSYLNGEFFVLRGHLPDDFHLSFEEYVEKYGYDLM